MDEKYPGIFSNLPYSKSCNTFFQNAHESRDPNHESLPAKNLPDAVQEKSVVLYVNYFGLCGNNVKRLYRELPKNSLLIDNSQALFRKHQE